MENTENKITFEILDAKTKSVVSTNLTKYMVYYLFIDKRINKNGKSFYIKDSHGLEISFNEFSQFYSL